MAGSQSPDLETVLLRDGTILPALYFPNRDFVLAFGDGDAPNDTGTVEDRWKNNDKYLHLVAKGLNTSEGAEFVVKSFGKETIQMFPYIPENKAYVAPCLVTETLKDGKKVVVVYSFGPK